jgi:hypothetical protein
MPLQPKALLRNFGITESFFHKNGNMALRTAWELAAAICGYGNIDYDYKCDCMCHVI